MRPAQVLTGWVVLFILAGTGLAQTAPYEAVIAVPEVEVRSGPSAQFYATSKLGQGAKVRVVMEEPGGWLAIEPPPGSFSWINARLVEPDASGQTAMVTAPEAPVRPGSQVVAVEPNVEKVQLPRGTQVLITGKALVAADGNKWLPIQPQKEYRYIPKDAIKTTPAVENLTAQSSRITGVPQPVGIGPAPSDTLWTQAEQARLAGNLTEARRLYELCAKQPGIDYDTQVRCYNRLQSLRNGNLGSAPMEYQPGRSSVAISGAPPAAGTPLPPYPPAGMAPPVPPGGQSQVVGYAQPPPVPATTAPAEPPTQRSVPGRLRRAGFFVDGKQAYVLEDSSGRPNLYVTAQPGVNLETFINRIITLAGPIVYRGDLRSNYMMAAQVYPMQ